jgi:hypothetical protein
VRTMRSCCCCPPPPPPPLPSLRTPRKSRRKREKYYASIVLSVRTVHAAFLYQVKSSQAPVPIACIFISINTKHKYTNLRAPHVASFLLHPPTHTCTHAHTLRRATSSLWASTLRKRQCSTSHRAASRPRQPSSTPTLPTSTRPDSDSRDTEDSIHCFL